MNNSDNPYHVGVAKENITCLIPGVGMQGWAKEGNTAESIETHLHARAFAFHHIQSDKKFVWVGTEICFITLSIYTQVIERLQKFYPELGYSEQNVMLTANHTHSAPGGTSHYVFYNLMIPGYCPAILEVYTSGIVRAIVNASKNREPARLYLGTSKFDPDIPVAFNRSISSYNLNKDVEEVTFENRHLALDRKMVLLKIVGENSRIIGVIDWFGVHTTSVHNDKHTISSDNKGYAAICFEKWLESKGHKGAIVDFAQTTPGDVTPNFQKFKGNDMTRGVSEDDYESKNVNGKFQFELAQEAFLNAENELTGNIEFIQMYYDLSNIAVDPQISETDQIVKTGYPAFGVPFLMGTEEGPGLPEIVIKLLKRVAKFRNLKDEEIHGEKDIFVHGIDHIFLGSKSGDTGLNLAQYLPNWTHPALSFIKNSFFNGSFGTLPLVPTILPIQIVIIDKLAIIGLPAEPTTVTGRRISEIVKKALKHKEIDRIIVQGYTNGYAGYITTFEEYANQRYEGTHTLYGKWTCAAYQTICKEMSEQLNLPEDKRNLASDLKPHKFTEEELNKRLWNCSF